MIARPWSLYPHCCSNEKQVRQLVDDLEVRYLGNMSANLHFALLTDLPDSDEQPREEESIVEFCGQLIRELNEKYAGNARGTFAMFHRHRVYNPREGVWMGWERKRGKLLDFNRLVLGQYDSFPYKVGDLSVLPRVRYVLTLDADTELPRGTAQRLIGTLAHPLCQADYRSSQCCHPRLRNSAAPGRSQCRECGAVQARVHLLRTLPGLISIRTRLRMFIRICTAREHSWARVCMTCGAVHRVLDHRFPRNAILSHDLIEGAYARAGLVSDVEIVDRYPSHYSAYIRRQAPLGSRRLADRGVAISARAGREWPSRAQSYFAHFALENCG